MSGAQQKNTRKSKHTQTPTKQACLVWSFVQLRAFSSPTHSSPPLVTVSSPTAAETPQATPPPPPAAHPTDALIPHPTPHARSAKNPQPPSHMCYSQELKDTQRRTRVQSRDKEWQDPGAKERQGPRTKERCATQGTPAGPRVYLRPWTPDLRVHLRLWRRTIRVYLRPQNARAQATP